MDGPLVFVDIDTQVDFMRPSGSLPVPGAEEIVPNLKKLMDYAQKQGIPILSSADAHPPDDPSFAQWPPHCVVGTPGQLRIPETQLSSPVIVPNRARAFVAPRKWVGQTLIEKTAYDFSTNPNFEAILASLRESLGEPRFVVFGVATEYCVRGAVLALRERKVAVDLVADAVRGITPEGERRALDEMRLRGANFVTTEDVCAPVQQKVVKLRPRPLRNTSL